MSDKQQPTPADRGWTEEEKSRGTPQAAEGADEAGTAGPATPTAKPTDDRAATEQAAAAIDQASEGDKTGQHSRRR